LNVDVFLASADRKIISLTYFTITTHYKCTAHLSRTKRTNLRAKN